MAFFRGNKVSRQALPEVPGLAGAADARGWQRRDPARMDSKIADPAHEITRVAYGAPRSLNVTVGPTEFADVYRGWAAGRMVGVATAWTYVQPGLFQANRPTPSLSLVTVELSTVTPGGYIQPRRSSPLMYHYRTSTQNPEFDQGFDVYALPGSLLLGLGPAAQQLMLSHPDWYFWAQEDVFGCASKGAFASLDDLDHRLGELLRIADAATVATPDEAAPDPRAAYPQPAPAQRFSTAAEHGVDDLIARLSATGDLDQAAIALSRLGPDDRRRLAAAPAPLARFADVRTPEQAMTIFVSLDNADRLKLMTILFRTQS